MKLKNNTIFFLRKIPTTGFESHLALLPDFLQREVLSHRKKSRQWASLWGKCLLRDYLLSQQLSPDLLQTWQRDALGKPHCEGIFSFNIAHSGEWLGLAISQSQQIGFDLQQVRFPQGFDAFAHLLHPDEKTHLQTLAEDELAEAFTQIWTKKEALFKCLGTGLTEDSRAVSVLENHCHYQNQDFYFEMLEMEKGYLACLASTHRAITLR